MVITNFVSTIKLKIREINDLSYIYRKSMSRNQIIYFPLLMLCSNHVAVIFSGVKYLGKNNPNK